MKINISNIPLGTSVYEVAKGARELGLPENFSGEAHAHVTLQKTSWEIVATIDAHVNAAFQCDRCAEDFVQQVDASYELLFTWSGTERITAVEEDYYVLGDGQKEIDLSDSVREYLQLAVPIKNVCREECLGLCSVCGTNLNERLCGCTVAQGDIRWSALQNLASNNDSLS